MKKISIAAILMTALIFGALGPAWAKPVKIGVQPWLGYGPW